MTKRFFPMLAISLLSSNVAFAQTDTVTSTQQVEEIEVVATRRDDVRSLAPQYSVSSTDFQRPNVSDIATALHHLPGITLRDYGGAGGMKTVSVRGMGSTHTGVALDGLLLSDIQSGNIDLQQFMFAELAGIRLNIGGNEDIFQPARNLSRGALLNVSTDCADSSEALFSGTASLTTGSWGLYEPALQLKVRTAKHAFSFGGSYLTAENDYPFTVENGVATHTERRVNNAVSQGVANVSWTWKASNRVGLKSFVRLSDSDRALPGIVHYYVNDNDEKLRDRNALAQSTLTAQLSSRIWLKSAVRWNWTEQNYGVGTSYMGIRSERYSQREYYATASLLYQPLRYLSFSYSADYIHNSLFTTIQNNPRPQRNSFLQSVSGKWSDGRFAFVANLLRSNVEDVHNLSPEFSTSYKLLKNNDFYIRASFKKALRMPTVTEQYYFHVGQRILNPETSRQFNVGLTFENHASNRLKSTFSIDAYINKVNDKIICIPYNMFVWRFMNLGKVSGKGVDATGNLNYNFPQGCVQMSFNYSLQSIENQTRKDEFYGNQIAYLPLQSGSGTLSWTNPWLNISATLLFASESWTTNEHHAETRIPGYYELSASAWRSFRLKKTTIDATLSVQNILDREYCIVARYPMPGRNLKLSLKYKF